MITDRGKNYKAVCPMISIVITLKCDNTWTLGWKEEYCSSVTFKCSGCFPSLPKTMTGFSSSVRDPDSIIYFSTIQLQYHSAVQEHSLGES